MQPPAGRNSGRSAADDRDFGVTMRHFGILVRRNPLRIIKMAMH